MYYFGLIAKAVLVGLLGSADGVVHTMSHPGLFERRGFCLLWASVAAGLHFSFKVVASSVATSQSGEVISIFLRFLVLGCIAFIIWSSRCESESHAGPWTIAAPRLWALPALLGAVDAIPVGFVKGLVFETSPALLVVQCAVSSVALGCTTFVVARLAARAHRRRRRTASTASAARVVHHLLLGVMFGIVLRDIHQQILG